MLFNKIIIIIIDSTITLWTVGVNCGVNNDSQVCGISVCPVNSTVVYYTRQMTDDVVLVDSDGGGQQWTMI